MVGFGLYRDLSFLYYMYLQKPFFLMCVLDVLNYRVSDFIALTYNACTMYCISLYFPQNDK